jgi:hypothetical protein
MKFGYRFLGLLAFAVSLSAQAATLTKTSKMSYGEMESFRQVALAAQKVAYNDFDMEVTFDVEAFKVSDAQSRSDVDSVRQVLSKLGYAGATELTDIDDQIDDTISAAFSVNLQGIPATAKAKMEKLEQEAGKYFSYGDTRIRVFAGEAMDANHYDINAIVVYDVQSQEVLVVASQKSE